MISNRQLSLRNSVSGDLQPKDAAKLDELLANLVDKNQGYFRALSNQRGQERMKAMMSLEFKRGSETLYQRDFVRHRNLKTIPILNLNSAEQHKTSLPMQLETVNKTDLIPHINTKVPDPIRKKDEFFIQPFNGDSTYNTQFVNWGSNVNLTMKPPAHPTIMKDMPFQASTFYRDNFKKFAHTECLPVFSKNQTFKNPVSPDLPFIETSTNKRIFKPYKTNFIGTLQKSQEFKSLPSFKGQFLSTNQADFINFQRQEQTP